MGKNKKGITLIALVVTIIVLLILAGVTITLLTGQNGILNRSQESALRTEISQLEELGNLAIAEEMVKTKNEVPQNSMILIAKNRIEEEGYEVLQQAVGEPQISNLILEYLPWQVTGKGSIKMAQGDITTDNIRVRKEEEGNPYCVNVKGNWYSIGMQKGKIVISREPVTLNSTAVQKEIKLVSIDTVGIKITKATSGVELTVGEILQNGEEIKVEAISTGDKQEKTYSFVIEIEGTSFREQVDIVVEPERIPITDVIFDVDKLYQGDTTKITATPVPTDATDTMELEIDELSSQYATMDSSGNVTISESVALGTIIKINVICKYENETVKTIVKELPVVLKTYTVTIEIDNPTYGTVSANTVTDVPKGTQYTTNGKELTINGNIVTASENVCNETGYEYRFNGWNPESQTVNSDITITAKFVKEIEGWKLLDENGNNSFDVGETVTRGAEKFLVMPNSTDDDVEVLAKYNLNTTTLTQSKDSPTTVRFSTAAYWNSWTSSAKVKDLNTYGDDSKDVAIKYARQYAQALGLEYSSGRLLRRNEISMSSRRGWRNIS